MATGKEVAKPEEKAVAVFDADLLAEMEAASNSIKAKIDLASDVRLPQLRLVQATTQNIDSTPGKIWDTLTSQDSDEAFVVPIQMGKSRAYFGSGTIGDPPVCTSADAVTGVGSPGGDCTRCPHADWRSGGRCQLRYNYLMMLLGEGHDPENELPRGVMMHGTSAKVASRLNTMLLGSKYPWSTVVALNSATEKNDRGQYKVWNIRKERDASPEEQMLAFKWFKILDAASSVTISDDPPAAPVAEGKDDIPF
jgi:hypothetical protein